MKLNYDNLIDIESEDIGEFVTKEAGIEEKNISVLFEMFSTDLYSNPEGSIVREIVSNCFDSHIEAKVDTPVVVEMLYDEGQYYLQFQDFGVGLSPERIDKVYLNYLSSTKRDSNDYIGAFGLGSKSPLSYSPFFYIITVFDGIKYHYIMSKTKTKPSLDLMMEEETQEHNGTIIKLPVQAKDVQKFEKELTNQLFYFDNVYVKGNDIVSFENIYHVYDFNTFKYRTVTSRKEMSLVIDKVNYPIDWSQIGYTEPILIPVALKFKIGELPVTPNRESIRYTDEGKQLIKERLKGCLEELRALSNKRENYVCDSLRKFRDLRKRDDFRIKLRGEDYIPIWKNYSKKSPIKSPRYVLDIFQDIPFSVFYEWVDPISFSYSSNYIITERGTVNKLSEDISKEVLNSSLTRIFWLTKGEGKDRVKNYYIHKYLTDESTYSSPKKSNFILKTKKKSFKDLKLLLSKKFTDLKLPNGQRNFTAHKLGGKSRLQVLKDFRNKIENEVKSLTYDYDLLKVPDWVVKEYKAKFYPPKIITQDGLNVVEYIRVNRGSQNFLKKELKVNLLDLKKHKGYIVYSSKEDIESLYKTVHLLSHRTKIRFIAFNKTQIKLIKDFKNVKHYSQVTLESDHLYRNIVVASYLNNFDFLSNFLTTYFETSFSWQKELSTKFYHKLKKIRDFHQEYKSNSRIENHEELFYKFLPLSTISEEFKFVEQYQQGLVLFSFNNSSTGTKLSQKEYREDAIFYLKSKKKKLNSDLYIILSPEEQNILKQAEELKEYRRQIGFKQK